MLTVAAAAVPASALQSVDRDCSFEPGSGLYTQRTVGTSVTIFQRSPRIRCDGGIVIRADSLAYYGATNRFELIGDVFYADSTRSMTAVRATYRRDFGQLVANGAGDTAVVVTDLADGSRLTGLNLDYREAGGGRLEDEVTISGRLQGGARPSAILPVARPAEADPDAPEPTPFDVTADRIFLRGENFFEARGDVDVLRDSLVTHSDALEYDQVRATLDLTGRASLIQGADSIEGRRVLVRLPEDEIREIEAIGEGSLLSRDLDLESPWFRISFVDGEVDGLWAAPLRRGEGPASTRPDSIAADSSAAEVLPLPADERLGSPAEAMDIEMSPQDSLDALQPVAQSGATRITADSLDVAATVGVIDSVRAVGRAYAVSRRDSIDASMLPEIAAQDWIRGDTIVATFLPRQEADSTVYSLDRIVSAGNASSLYRLAPEPGTAETDSIATGALPQDTLPSAAVDPVTDTVPTSPPDPAAGEDPAIEPVPGVPEGEPEVILPASAPGVHYVVAARIILVFEDDEVRRMEIFGLTEGVHLEPRRRATAVESGPGGAS
jgi:lipopolysaccharide export system protein LptA